MKDASKTAKPAAKATKAADAPADARVDATPAARGSGKGAAAKTAKAADGAKTPAARSESAKLAEVAKPAAEKVPALNAKAVEKLKKRLEEERDKELHQAEELLAEAESLAAEREQGDTQFDEESGEGDTISIERERDLALSASARQAVEEIDRALARIEAGTYGQCERCSKRIAPARLEALPQAALCIECASRLVRRR